MRMLSMAASAALLLCASPAAAQSTNWETSYWEGTNYDVTASAVGATPGCIMTSTFRVEGRSNIDFALTYNGERAIFSLTSPDWSAVDDQRYDGFNYYFPQSETIFNGGATHGYVYQYINKGFVTSFGDDFLVRLAAENRLVVGRMPDGGEMTIVADLNLTGSAPAVAALRRCTTHVVNREAARIRRESRNDYIARDPFRT